MREFNGNIACNVYEELFKEIYNSNSFSNRMKMQKMLYILKTMKYIIGEYNFTWFVSSGVYSTDLHEELHQIIKDDTKKVTFNKFDTTIFEKFMSLLEINYFPYTKREWLDVISSLIYLSNNHYRTKEALLEDLGKKRITLIHTNINEIAFDILKKASLIKNIHLMML